MRISQGALLLSLGLALACAEGSTDVGGSGGLGAGGSRALGGAGHVGGSGAGAGGQGAGGIVAHSCPDGQFAHTIDQTNTLVCTAIDGVVRDAVNEHCSLFFGWRDSCSGCTSDPAKWGRVNGTTCNNGVGVDDSCTPAQLKGDTVQMFGLNTDGDVNGDDKFYAGMQCDNMDVMPRSGPCEVGEMLASLEGGDIGCVSLTALVSNYVRDSCTLYYGWADGCGGCTSDPTKWGKVTSTSCDKGIGINNTCTVAALGGPIVNLLGIDLDGDVDDNDKFYVGLSCVAASAQSQDGSGSCPAGMLVQGINQDGSLACASPLPVADAVIRQSCHVYTGWRDSCNGCTTTPSKWGRVSQDECLNGAGNDNTCTVANLGGETVRLFGLNTDGDVNGDDKFHYGFRCLAK